jgi:predicted TIM-barrel fold metal-dependent hydrolase
VYREFGGLAPKYVARPGTGWDPMFGMMPNMLRDQVLYGSDWPVMTPQRALREWRETGLDERALRALLHDNAARLFGLPAD